MSSTTDVVPFALDHVEQLAELFNAHDLRLPGVEPMTSGRRVWNP
jgi:hypothetical protein